MEKDQYIDLLGMMLKGEKEKLLRWADKSLENNITPQKLIDILTGQMAQLGTLWDTGKIFLPEVIMAVNIFEKVFNDMGKLLPKREETDRNIFILGTVEGDIHNLGKDIVKMVLQSGGIRVIDLGINVKADAFINTLKDQSAPILGLSALMTTTMAKQKEVIQRLIHLGLREKVKVIVGGAPVTQEWADKIGADAYAANAFEALRKINLFVE